MADERSANEHALFEDRSRRLLIARSRLGLWILLTFILLFSLADRLFNPGGFDAAQVRELTVLRVAQVLWIAATFAALRRVQSHRGAVAICALFMAMFSASIALAGVAVRDAALAPTVLMGASMFSAAFLPWGPWPQLAVVLFSAVCIAANAAAVSGSLAGIVGYNQLEACAVLAASLWVAANLHRQRLDLFLSQRARDAAMQAQLRSARIADGLARAGREMIEAVDDPRLAERICAITAAVLDCDTVHAFLVDADGEWFIPAAAHGESPETWERLRLLPLPRDTLTRILESDDVSEIVGGPLDTRDGVERMLTPASGTAAGALVIALRRGNVLGGVLRAITRRTPGRFSEEQRRIARGIAHLGSMTIEHVRVRADLERANRVKDHFVATLSHELRAPIAAIDGYHDLLLQQDADGLSHEQADFVRRANARTKELNDLITATLDLSRFEARRVPLDIQSLQVADLIDELRREIQPPADNGAVRLEWRTANAPATLRSDPLKIKMVLRNLITNALKFTEQGVVTVAAAARNGGVEFRVSDTGIGIAADKVGSIFEPFTQAHGLQSRRKGGAGLGLHLVRRLVDVLGGTVNVASEVGRGTTFSVWVPQRSTEEASCSSANAA